MKAAHLYSSAPCQASPATSGFDQPPSASIAPVPSSPTGIPSPAALPGTSRKARNTMGGKARRKGRKKRGRPKRKAQTLTSRYLRSHQPEKLRRTEVQKLIRADRFATRTGRHLGTFVTLRWVETTLGEANINRRFSALLNAARIWASRRGIEWAALAVHENPLSDKPAFNTHVLCNIPGTLHLAFTEWLVKQLGGSAGAIHIRPRVCPGAADETLSYMLKGTDYLTAKWFNLIRPQGWKFDQGQVDFRRCTVSRNINAAAIAAWKGTDQFSDTIKKGAGEFRDQYARAKDRLLTATKGSAA